MDPAGVLLVFVYTRHADCKRMLVPICTMTVEVVFIVRRRRISGPLVARCRRNQPHSPFSLALSRASSARGGGSAKRYQLVIAAFSLLQDTLITGAAVTGACNDQQLGFACG